MILRIWGTAQKMYNSINLRASSTVKYKNINIAAVHGLFNDLIVE